MTKDSDPPDEQTRAAGSAGEPDANVVRVDFRRGARVQDTAGPAAGEKREVFESLIASGMVMVTLDARRPGVSVPSRFAKDAQLNLNFSHRFGVSDFSYDERGVRCTLTFGGHPFFCDVPWGAVWGLRSHVDNPDHVTVFHDALPEELVAMLPPAAREQLDRAQERRDADKGAPRSATPVPRSGAPAAPVGPPTAPPSRGGLRLVRPLPPSGEGAALNENNANDPQHEADVLPDPKD